MARLGRVIVEAVVHHYGRDEMVRRLASPFWFQSFGAVMGMDWHSSGITTSVLGALKRGLGPLEDELGLYVCGGRGRHSRRTPDELLADFDAACARSRATAARFDSLDSMLVKPNPLGHPVDLRWLFIHMIEEYARHCGHADLLREAIDGVTGD